jgi:hypothetical protein
MFKTLKPVAIEAPIIKAPPPPPVVIERATTPVSVVSDDEEEDNMTILYASSITALAETKEQSDLLAEELTKFEATYIDYSYFMTPQVIWSKAHFSRDFPEIDAVLSKHFDEPMLILDFSW